MEDMNCLNIPVHVSKLTSLCLPSIKSWPTWSLIANTPIARTDILHAVHGTLLEQNIRYVVPQCAMKKYRKQIPISSKKWDILNGIANNKVILIRGIVTVGKSSQVAQFILEDAAALNKSVHVILLKPQIFGTRDLAEKIAMDRGEIVGSTVGYISTYERIHTAITSLFVSTYEVFLKTFVGRTDFLNTVTHLIIDDVDKKSVFHNLIMYIIRKHKSRFPKLKVILLSDSDNNDQIISYFRPVTINVNAKQATVMMSYTQNKLTSFPIETMNNKLDLSEFLRTTKI
ncbi:PREDICTED: DExH-box ATP-dependent RNA helicase DExH1-like [Nicrophorus vespilloides]|uniref:DExH-box ATP-dependent RNA helicase DExH1-like n=1 Tax=Nicrophorus vespilloides TaxID=110193 RepID=A0ABM1MY64_NICVS|nr:PREDICTED: DExH-box ATP-dependent RNA helicase DExH1-like [Nicrophorus vespilloides]